MKILRVVSPASAIVLVLFWGWPAVAAAEIEIEHDELEKVKSGVRVDLESEISDEDDAGIRDVRAYFKTEPATRFFFVPLDANGGDDHRGVLPAMAAGTGSFDYFILARDNNNAIVKTDTWTVKIRDDERALARMEQKPPREVKIDVDQIEEAQDLVEDARKVTDTDRSSVAREGGEPNPNERVDVRTDTPDAPQQLAGVDDYINLRIVSPAEAISTAAVGSAATVSASSGGIGGTVLGGVAVAGAVGVAAAAGGGGGGDGGGSGGGSSAAACNSQQVAGQDAPEVRTIELGQTSGSFVFQFETFSQEDRLVVVYEGSPLFDTGCVGASGSRTLTYSGSSSRVTVAVQPNCAGGSGTAWNFTVNCP